MKIKLWVLITVSITILILFMLFYMLGMAMKKKQLIGNRSEDTLLYRHIYKGGEWIFELLKDE